MPEWASKGRNVKSGPGRGTAGAADGHERAKDFLTAAELAGLLEAAKAGRHGTRDHLLLMMIFRHGLRVSEAVSLRLDADVLEWFRQQGKGYQTRINRLLRAYMQTQQRRHS